MSVGSASIAAARSTGRVVDRLLDQPRTVVGTLIGFQIATTLALAFFAQHNGWVYFQGGDQIWFTTTGWLVGQLELPPTEPGYAWPLVQAPITWMTGPTFVNVLPPLVLLQVLVLGPVALVCLYGIATRIGGRLLGYWAALLWVVAPYAVIPLFVSRYHEKWVDDFLPQAVGLTAMADFPSMVLVLAAALFVVRSLSAGLFADAALAGLFLGAAGGTKPPNYLLGAGAILAYVVVRRWREAAVFALAVVPSVLALAFWKYRGLGEIPAVALEQVRVAASAGPLGLDVSLDRYVKLDFEHWSTQMDQLREFFWSARLAQWAPLAGLVAVLRVRRGAVAALLAGWLGAFIVVKGFSPRADIQANTFWRLLMPAWPAYLLLFASIPLLVPTLARRLGERLRPPAARPVRWRWVALTAAVSIGVPVAATAAATRTTPTSPAVVQEFESGNILTPVDTDLRLDVRSDSRGRRLVWTTTTWRAGVFYRVYRADGPGPDTQCALSASVAWFCYLHSVPIATTRDREFVDTSPPTHATYRIGVGTNWLNDPELGDVFVFSPPVNATG